jgi:spore germination cell wall hydrolase CwlJ-like protein
MRRQSKAGWAIGVIAPWCLGAGLLVSFTASAGQDPKSDWNLAPVTARMKSMGAPAILGGARNGDMGRARNAEGEPLIQTARLAIGAQQELKAQPDETEPHVDIKPSADGFPEVDRTHKGDPVISMRPSFESRNSQPLSFLDQPDLSFRVKGAAAGIALAPRSMLPGEENPLDAADAAAEPEPVAPATTQKSAGVASPAAPAANVATTTPSEAMKERAAHGATPAVARAVTLGSSTPAQPDSLPFEVASFPRVTMALSAPDRPAGAEGARPDYAALISADRTDREKRCLAEAVYFEARSEPEAGQAAVAQVVLNRVSSGLYPASVCGVVYQNRHHYKACQFSFACEGKSLRVTENESWATAVRIADEVMAGRTYLTQVGRSTHYHANYVRPRWARSLKKMDVIGHHIFYRIKS